jgi:hypothetical protein
LHMKLKMAHCSCSTKLTAFCWFNTRIHHKQSLMEAQGNIIRLHEAGSSETLIITYNVTTILWVWLTTRTSLW